MPKKSKKRKGKKSTSTIHLLGASKVKEKFTHEILIPISSMNDVELSRARAAINYLKNIFNGKGLNEEAREKYEIIDDIVSDYLFQSISFPPFDEESFLTKKNELGELITSFLDKCKYHKKYRNIKIDLSVNDWLKVKNRRRRADNQSIVDEKRKIEDGSLSANGFNPRQMNLRAHPPVPQLLSFDI